AGGLGWGGSAGSLYVEGGVVLCVGGGVGELFFFGVGGGFGVVGLFPVKTQLLLLSPFLV
ncbi:hypothetical protein Q6284_33635, partial [Klebsiella pneumoniae]|uniref:hypothetical protein n=1 Tax=Klebsiella pneumoniae TaxID=573 RepID=UPI00272FD5D0